MRNGCSAFPIEPVVLHRDRGARFRPADPSCRTFIGTGKLDEIKKLGYPVLLGTSRKSFIGFTLDLPPEERIEGTAATVAIGIARGADIIRVHDVKEMARVAKMTDAIVRIPPS